MLSSIHPLGERGRNNRWWLTVAAFAVGAMSVSAIVGAALGATGSALASAEPSGWIVAGAALLAVVLDALRVAAPGPRRQVNERWIGTFRGWVYGLAFGAQLGAAGATYIVTWLVYAAAVAASLSGGMAAGAAIGLSFGTVRTLPLLAARWIDRPSRLGAFHRRMAALGPKVRRATMGVVAVAAAIGVVV